MKRNVLRPYANTLERVLQLADPALVALTGWFAFLGYLGGPLPSHYLIALLAGALLCSVVFPLVGLYQAQRGWHLLEEPRRLLAGWALMVAGFAVLIFASKLGDAFSRVWAGLWLASGLAAHLVLRLGIRLALRALRRSGRNLRHIVIIGGGKLGADVISRLQRRTALGFKVIAVFDDADALQGTTVADVPVVGKIDALPAWLEREGADQVWIVLPMRAEERIKWLLEALALFPVQVRFVPDIYGFDLLHHSFTEVAGFPVINLTDTPMQGINVLIKALEDRLLSAVALLLLLPAFVVLAIGVKLSSPGPVFYRQRRVTWNGREFDMLKFRSMPVDAEKASGPVWARAGENRATRFGAFIRRTSLDELPQFLNVLRGDMSIVGPRPERPEFISQFKHQIPRYMQKHLVKAGITGWAQVNDLRGNTDLQRRIEFDLYYIENWSLWFDLRIMVQTAFKMLGSKNAY